MALSFCQARKSCLLISQALDRPPSRGQSVRVGVWVGGVGLEHASKGCVPAPASRAPRAVMICRPTSLISIVMMTNGRLIEIYDGICKHVIWLKHVRKWVQTLPVLARTHPLRCFPPPKPLAWSGGQRITHTYEQHSQTLTSSGC